jgi:uncharacterized protein YdiU (UPF0061 family)
VSLAIEPLFAFDNSFVRELPGLYERWRADTVPNPVLVSLNEPLAVELGLDPDALRTPGGVALLVGNAVPDGAEPVAQAYAGHQFGGYSPRLGDGRALLLGELVDASGTRRDVHLKGSGRTPFARGGDGKAALGPMLREHVVSEAMHALGVPTTRALAVVATGEHVARDAVLPGAVLARVASSHLRVGTFQYAAATGGPPLVQRLVAYAATRHHPRAEESDRPALALLEEVVEAQASLVARWMLVGFVHGVMNTDNMTISGETIDYGPCAFMEAFDPATVFSSIDHGGRYAYGNQPSIALWNLARLAETLLHLVGDDTHDAVAVVTDVLRTFPERYRRHWGAGVRAKLGLAEQRPGDDELVGDLLDLMHQHRVDHTAGFRSLSTVVRGEPDRTRPVFAAGQRFDDWLTLWGQRLEAERRPTHAVAAGMDRVNPAYIPRNHLVEEALAAATAGDLGPFERLLEAVTRPFDERPGLEAYASPAPASFGRYRTFCGT